MSAPLRVGFNLAYLAEDSGGSGTYARRLLPHLLLAEPRLELTAWVGSTAPEWVRSDPWTSEVRWVRLPVPGAGSPWHLWHELAGIGIDARRRRLQLMHGLANLAPVVHPGVPTLATILDVIWIHHPAAVEPRFRLVMRTLVPLVGRSATRLIAISQAAREDIAQTLHLDVGKFDVTPLGILPPPPRPATDAATRERFGLTPGPVILCVAAKRAHKNLHGLIRAFALLCARPQDGAPPQLVLPGSPNSYELELRALAEELGIAESVRFPGWVSDEELEELFALADCFVLPTLQEGFGLPVLEAMIRELPVVCSDIPVLREAVGDAALLFDPYDPAAIAEALGRVLDEPPLARELARHGLERARRFTWGRTAQATLASYERAASLRAGPR